MDNKNNSKNQVIKPKTSEFNDQIVSLNSGVYLRDDHCDWGSSGMNEFTKEFSKN